MCAHGTVAQAALRWAGKQIYGKYSVFHLNYRNYAPTIMPQAKAALKGCQQNLWLAGEDLMLTEVGAMNIFVLWENEQGGNLKTNMIYTTSFI